MSRPETAAWICLTLAASAFLGYRSFQRELGVQRDINERARVLLLKHFDQHDPVGEIAGPGW